MTARRYHLDASVSRHGTVLIGGSPLKLFRLTPAGATVLDSIAAGDPAETSSMVAALLDAGAIHPSPTPPRRFGRDDVTIVVPALGAPTDPPPGAVIVDDGTEPPIPGAAIRFDINRGPAAARNAGAASVTTPLVAFVDADVSVTDTWLDGLLSQFDDERVGLVAPRVMSAPGPTALARYERAHSPLDLGAESARVRAGSRVSYVPAAALVCRVDAWRAVGGFDETLRAGEDVDLVWRLDAAGWRVRFEPSVIVTHRPRPDWVAWAKQRVVYGASAAPLAARHDGALAPLRMSGWSLATWGLGAVGAPVAGAALGVGSAIALAGKLRDVPSRVAIRLAALGNLRAGEQIANAIRRTWWPILAVLALRSRRARRVLVGAALAARHPVRLIDDVAYSIGVWKGIATERTLDPLVPEISSWPGRRSPERPEADH